MRIPRPTHSGLVAYLALAIALSGTAYSANGGSLILGGKNTETRPTTIRNSNGPAFNFRVPWGSAPFTVNQATKVAGLNADRIDGLSAEKLQRKLEVKVVSSSVSSYSGSAQCPSGWTALGGGYSNGTAPVGHTIRVDRDAPSYGLNNVPTGWSVWAETDDFQDVQRTIFVICAR